MREQSVERHAIIEVIPVERIEIATAHEFVEAIGKSLASTRIVADRYAWGPTAGLSASFDGNPVIKSLLSDALSETPDEYERDIEQYIWLACEHFDRLFVAHNDDDVLFGLSGTKGPEHSGGPYGRQAEVVAMEMGSWVSASSLPRVICASVLRASGFKDLSEAIGVKSNLTFESALQATIEFIDDPQARRFPFANDLAIFDLETNTGIGPIDFISSSALLSQSIVRILQDEGLVSSITIGQGFPLQLFSLGASQGGGFSLFNHFWLKLRPGTLKEAVQELLAVALHLNWSVSREPGEKLSPEQVLLFALAQSARLKRLEEQESAVRHAINVLQKRYPGNVELIRLEVNNQYANLVRYSPTYARWKKGLSEVIEGQRPAQNWFASLIQEVDWSRLEHAGLVQRSEGGARSSNWQRSIHRSLLQRYAR